MSSNRRGGGQPNHRGGHHYNRGGADNNTRGNASNNNRGGASNSRGGSPNIRGASSSNRGVTSNSDDGASQNRSGSSNNQGEQRNPRPGTSPAGSGGDNQNIQNLRQTMQQLNLGSATNNTAPLSHSRTSSSATVVPIEQQRNLNPESRAHGDGSDPGGEPGPIIYNTGAPSTSQQATSRNVLPALPPLPQIYPERVAPIITPPSAEDLRLDPNAQPRATLAAIEHSEVIQGSGIPDIGLGVGDFNSVPFRYPPFRDMFSPIIQHLLRPDVLAGEPNWPSLLEHYHATHGGRSLENLQDLLLLLSHTVLPNLVIQNRHFLQLLYQARPNISTANTLRYDQWHATNQYQEQLGSYNFPRPQNRGRLLPLNYTKKVQPRSIFRSRQTPDGSSFIKWLSTKLHPGQPGNIAATHLKHQSSELDTYMAMPESTVRTLTLEQLLRRTIRILRMFWWLVTRNYMLDGYERIGWSGVQRHDPPPPPPPPSGGDGGPVTYRY